MVENGGNVRISQHIRFYKLLISGFVLANMKVITSIYLNCRPDLRDEWLAGIEPDDAGEAQVKRGLPL